MIFSGGRNPISRVYFYKMTVDNGGVPCVENGLLSLAICKPQIRSTCKTGDIIFGFSGKRLKKKTGDLIYASVINNKLKNSHYFTDAQYSNRSDCVYEKSNGAYRQKRNSKYHSENNLTHDIGADGKRIPPVISVFLATLMIAGKVAVKTRVVSFLIVKLSFCLQSVDFQQGQPVTY